MRLLQRYILGELLKVFAFLISVVTVLLIFVGVISDVSEYGLGPIQILQILPYVVPSLLPFTIPATLLLTVCLVYGRVAGDHEITAAKAAGINVLSLLWPAFWLGALLTFCSLVLTDQVIPWAMANIQRTVTLAMEDIFLDRLRSHHQVSDRERGYSITVMGVEGRKLIMPTFKYAPPGRSEVSVQASEATLEFDLERQQVVLHLVNCYFDIAGQKGGWFKTEQQAFPMPFRMSKPKPRHLTIRDIRRNTRTLSQRNIEVKQQRDIETVVALTIGDFDRFLDPDFLEYDRRVEYDSIDLAKLQTEIHSRFALSSSCLFFVLLGGPFAILQGKRQFLTSFSMCFGPILVVYYPVVLLMMNLSKSGTVNPVWAMWVGNALLLIAAIWVLRKVLEH